MPVRPPMRIVSLAPSATNILCSLGAQNSLVAVTRWCKDVVPAEAIHGLPVFDDCWSADARKVAELKPDLVIGSVPYRGEVDEKFLGSGLRFLAKAPHSLKDIHGDIALLAGITGKFQAGEELILKMRDQIEEASRHASKAQKRPRIYCEVWPNPPRNCEHWAEEMVEAAGGEFVPRPAGRPVTSEEMIAANPEIIVLAWAGTGNRARAETVAKRAGWDKIQAVREKRIHVMRDEWLNTPAPVLLKGLKALTEIIRP